MPRRVFITVAEVSGDQHAAKLIESLRQAEPGIIVEGLGGPAMAAAGAIIHQETVGERRHDLRGRCGAGGRARCCAGRGAISKPIAPICKSVSIRQR